MPLFLKRNWIHIGVHQESPGRDRRDEDEGQKLEKQEFEDQSLQEQELQEHGS